MNATIVTAHNVNCTTTNMDNHNDENYTKLNHQNHKNENLSMSAKVFKLNYSNHIECELKCQHCSTQKCTR